MKIQLLVNQDLASTLVINRLVPALQDHELSIWCSSQVGTSNQARPPALAHLAFMEQGILNQLLPGASGGELQTISALAASRGISCRIENAPNGPAALANLTSFRPDLMVSVRYGKILRQACLGFPGYGVINLHSGRLPDYRGVMATFRAMLAGEKTIGATLHYIDDDSVDTGRIIGMTDIPVNYAGSYLHNVLALYHDGVELILTTIADIAKGESPRTLTQRNGGNYYSFPDQPALDAFSARGLRLFDHEEVIRLYQRFSPV
ncbi:MAG: formyl transferase [Pseudomonadales bacterium]|nr:formyl transferase [Pseudomonadales bacterium]